MRNLVWFARRFWPCPAHAQKVATVFNLGTSLSPAPTHPPPPTSSLAQPQAAYNPASATSGSYAEPVAPRNQGGVLKMRNRTTSFHYPEGEVFVLEGAPEVRLWCSLNVGAWGPPFAWPRGRTVVLGTYM